MVIAYKNEESPLRALPSIAVRFGIEVLSMGAEIGLPGLEFEEAANWIYRN